MTSTQINAFIYKLSSTILIISIIWFIAKLDIKFAVFFAGLIVINNAAKFLYIMEQSKEDDVFIAKLHDLLEKETKHKNDV